MAQEWIRSLEEQVATLQGQLEREQRRNAELVNDLKAATPHEQRRPRWRFWQGLKRKKVVSGAAWDKAEGPKPC